MTGQHLLTRRQVAELLGCSVRSVDRHRASGALIWVNIATTGERPIVRFLATDVEHFLFDRREGGRGPSMADLKNLVAADFESMGREHGRPEPTDEELAVARHMLGLAG